ncbi:MAG TPA: hypothetical protein VFP47_05975, partial [Pyrinomonadaceae bacterium]|nr:hypothetical protein [Pyrinomonadaceae bacterium]
MKTHRRFGTGVESSGFSDHICFDSAISLDLLRRRLPDEVTELIPLSHAFNHELMLEQMLFNDRVSH